MTNSIDKKMVTSLLIMAIVAYILISVIVCKMPHFFFDAGTQRMDGKRIRGNTLLVIAHPDDESMFFGPTLVSLQKQKRGRDKLQILCLSNGDADGQNGEKRQEEFFSAAQTLGLSASDVTVILSDRLKDGRDWSEILIANIVHQHCLRNAIRNVLTFDEYGVSGHKNHVSIFHAVKTVPGITLFALESVPLLRKYASFLDLPLSLVLNYVRPSKPWAEIVSMDGRRLVLHALHQHQSQMVWFRRLYSLFSRYLYINTFQVYK